MRPPPQLTPDLYSVAESSVSGQVAVLFQLAGVGQFHPSASQNHHNVQQLMLSAYNRRLRC